MKKIAFLTLSALALSVQAKDPTLFVQQAKSALFTPTSNGCYTLTLVQPKKRILYFASAPKTDIGRTDTKTYLKAWDQENQILNAAFTGDLENGKERDYAFRISNPSVEKATGRMNYTACPLKQRKLSPNAKAVFSNVSVFIDPFHNWPP